MGDYDAFAATQIRIFAAITHKRYRGFNELQIEGSEIIKNLPDTNVLFISNHQTYFADVVAMFHVFNASLSGRQDNIKKFQDPNSKARFFIGNPQTGGYGITLTAANNVIYYSNGYDLEKRLQSEDRAHRIGQKKAVTYVDLIAPKTVDEKIRKALRKKINIATQVMGEELRDWI